MTSSDEEALLYSVLTHPDDDTARLVLADWYSEHGQEDRGEFIRLQVESARQGLPGGGRRIATLMRRHRASWCNPLKPELVGPWTRGVQEAAPFSSYAVSGVLTDNMVANSRGHRAACLYFCRGFPEHIGCSVWSSVIGGMEEWLRRWPVRFVELSNPLAEGIRVRSAAGEWTAEYTRCRWARDVNGPPGLYRGSRAELVAAINPWLQDVYHRLYAGVPA